MRSLLQAIALLAPCLFGLSQGAAVIYEPFDYTPGSLGSAGGTTEVGLSGTWTVNTTPVSSGSLSWGSLVTGGNSVGPTSNSQNRFMGARSISAGTLSSPGLLDDGEELWFSVIMGYAAGGNRTNSRLAFALADSAFTGANFDYDLTGGTGLGVTVGRFGINGKIIATQFTTNAGNSGFDNNIFDPNANENSISATFPGSNANEDVQLIVGRITWGATSDTIDLFLPGTDLALPGAVHSSLTVNVDQSGYDTLTMQRGDAMVMDEIRFGATYLDVVPVPEPSALLLSGLGSLLLLRRRV